MDFSWSQEDLEFRNEVIAFAKSELNDDVISRDKKGIFPRELWQKCADFGILGLAAPARFGGMLDEVDILRSVLAMQAMGYACKDGGLVLGLNAQMWTVQMSIVLFGTDAQKQKFLPKLTSGEWLGAHALTEAGSGSDVYNMEMTAEKTDGGYFLNGEKRLVTLAPIADMAIVFANVNPALGKWGVTAFVLKYRLPDDSINIDRSLAPLQDAQQAIRFVRTNAKEFGVDRNKIGIMGFSAGGHLASTAATHFTMKADLTNNDTVSVRPDFAILIYPVISFDSTFGHKGSRNNLVGANAPKKVIDLYSNELQVTSVTPPAFLIHTGDDATVPVENSIRFYQACIKNKVPAEMHIYPGGGHGFGMYNRTTDDSWMERLRNWLSKL